MSSHIANDLPRLLTGEASRDEVMTGAAHLRTCVDCQHELVSAVVAHASLSSAHRFAPEMLSARPEAEATIPDAAASETPSTDDAELPDLSAVFAQVRKEAAESAPRRSSHTRYAIAAAAAVVVAGGAAAIGYVAASGGNSSPTRTVQLSAFDKGTTSATATMAANDSMRIDAAGLPKLVGKRYEVWLTNAQRTRMQPIGWLGNNDMAAMNVPADLLHRFDHIEISVQPVDAKSYDYSGTSVLRGGYE